VGKQNKITAAMLWCGALSGPLFIITVLVQDYTRAGVEPRAQPLSLLTLGDLGWIQIANFVVAGALNLAYALGLRRALHPGRAGTWGALLIGVYGFGLVSVGVFVPDPAFGYPPGTPMGASGEISWHGALHSVGAVVVFGSLIPACFVFARRFAAEREWGWTLYCVVSGLAVLTLFLSTANQDIVSLSLRAAVAVGWSWGSVTAARLIATHHREPVAVLTAKA
jgi:hypothetical protein